MVIKLKGWTALPAVKIVSFVLIILLAFAFLSSTFLMMKQFDNNDINLDIVFANASGNELFYRSYMNKTLNDLRDLLFFESEDNIKKGNCIQWVKREDGGWWLESTDGSHSWSNFYGIEYSMETNYGTGSYDAAEAASDDFTVSWDEAGYTSVEKAEQRTEQQIRLQRESLEKDAINNQLQSFRSLQERLQKRNGFIYYVSKQGFEASNTGGADIDLFTRQPVYMLIENGICIAQSFGYYTPPLGDYTVYAGYTAETINAQTAYWQSMQKTVIVWIIAAIGMAVLAFALLVTLLCGAGRKRYDDTVYFNILDKPYLDIGICLLIWYEVIISWIFAAINSRFGGYNPVLDSATTRRILGSIAAAAVLMLPPALYYIMSLAKRVKAGKWWRYTLVWRIWNAIWGGCVNFVKSLWAGAPLTLRVGLAVLCLYCVMVIVAALSGADGMAIAMSILAAAAFAVPMLRYARRLRRLEDGARAVSEGNYAAIDIRGGELGKIAGYINNISAGIENAVEERLKSERLKTELITNVSHDIRTPLTSLITYTDLLKSEGLTSEKAPEYLDVLIQKSQRLKTLTDELFEAAKASSGNIETHLETLDFAALMRQVLGELDERIQASGLDFRLNLPEHMWVLADGKLLWRVAENLLSNVFKYTLPQSRVYIDLAREGSAVRLDIKNISARPLNVDPSELTERFKRGDESRSSEGSGLGLSIVQSFIEAQNGRFKLMIDGDLFKASVYMPAAK